eukprot:1368257-Amorphochlora_amoeboformis.AAC.1
MVTALTTKSSEVRGLEKEGRECLIFRVGTRDLRYHGFQFGILYLSLGVGLISSLKPVRKGIGTVRTVRKKRICFKGCCTTRPVTTV